MTAPGAGRPERTMGRHLGAGLARAGMLLLVAALLMAVVLPRLSYDTADPPLVGSRTLVWFVMELHVMFAAFVLGVPIFALIVEIVGMATGDARYDRLGREFARLLALAFTTTAAFGVAGLTTLVCCYPKLLRYLAGVFSPTFWPYALLILSNAVLVVGYYAAWDRLQGRRKWWHVAMGVALNGGSAGLMAIASAWSTFMMSPAGVTPTGALVSLAEAVQNPLWLPIVVHRLIANVAFGGAIVAAYAAVRFLAARTDQERARWDWMGYVGNFVAMWALIPLPFAGYWLGKEIYGYSAEMGTNLMGGEFSWLFVIQAVLIGSIFIAANYYMWCGLARIPGGRRYYRYVLALEVLVFAAIAVWVTPHSLVASLAEARRMGGARHPLLGVFGVMSAKNTAVNLVILATFISFLLYRRANRTPVDDAPPARTRGATFILLLSLFPVLFCGARGWFGAGAHAEARLPVVEAEVTALRAELRESTRPLQESWPTFETLAAREIELERLRGEPGRHHAAGFRVLAGGFALLLALALADLFVLRGRVGGLLQGAVMLGAASVVVMYGVRGYFVSAEVRIGYSVYQVMAVLFALIVVTALDLYRRLGTRSLGAVEWGRMPVRSQYTLVFIAVAFVLTTGIMGLVRSGIREGWHVYGILRDPTRWAHTPTMAYGATVVALASGCFLLLVAAIFRFGYRETPDAD